MPLQPMTNPLVLPLGVLIPEADGYDFTTLPGGGGAYPETITPEPPTGLTVSTWTNSYGVTKMTALYGTPTVAGTTEHSVRITDGGTVVPLTIVVEAPAPEPVTAAAPVFDDAALTVTIPEVVGVVYSVNGTERAAGTYPATPEATMTVTAEPVDAGYALEGETEWSHDFPAGVPDPLALLEADPQTELVIDALAPRVVKHAGRPADEAGAEDLARAGVSAVLQYVNGYTRGRGFHGMVPERDLQAVIVASSARLFTNPEQVTSYTLGDYTERPAILNGWTMAEMAVLRRHRVTYR